LAGFLPKKGDRVETIEKIEFFSFLDFFKIYLSRQLLEKNFFSKPTRI
jgi:hypothetical protein